MILPFSTQINGKPTHFVEKIWEAFFKLGIKANAVELLDLGKKALPEGYIIKTYKPKIHSFREDKKNRWKAGVIIDFFINTRTKDMFRFAPRVPCISTQTIEIVWSGGSINLISIYIDDECYVANYGKEYNTSTQRQTRMELISQNDGFDTVEDFLNYFNTDFTGKIIHWTDFTY